MSVLLAFAVTLLLAVLISDVADRTVLSTAVLFLAAGFVLGNGMLGVVSLRPGDPLVSRFTELALFTVLFTEGMQLPLGELRTAWRLPGRALLLGMPLTLGATAVLAHVVVGLPWPEALLIGAVLSPTDPVFAATLVGHRDVPERLRRLLNIESGVNDGLALPLVILMLAVVSRSAFDAVLTLLDLALGVAVGVAVPWVAITLEKSRLFSATAAYQPLNALAIGLLVLSLTSLMHANEFLGAFAAGVTVATAGPAIREAFRTLGWTLSEVLKLAGVLVLGALLSPRFLAQIPLSGYAFALLVLLAVRPFALALALLGSALDWRERAVAAWFGPKGFASVLYALLILQSHVAPAERLFHLVAIVVAASIIAHSSSDVPVARWFRRREERNLEATA